jgi:predicted flavoprotein YhiN
MADVRATVDGQGGLIIDHLGFQGPGCLQAAAALKRVLAERYGITLQDEHITTKPELGEAAVEERQQAPHVEQEGA